MVQANKPPVGLRIVYDGTFGLLVKLPVYKHNDRFIRRELFGNRLLIDYRRRKLAFFGEEFSQYVHLRPFVLNDEYSGLLGRAGDAAG